MVLTMSGIPVISVSEEDVSEAGTGSDEAAEESWESILSSVCEQALTRGAARKEVTEKGGSCVHPDRSNENKSKDTAVTTVKTFFMVKISVIWCEYIINWQQNYVKGIVFLIKIAAMLDKLPS